MGRKIPPFAAVRAFEAAARRLSFKEAAEELCVSPSAISHQIRALEEFLDTALFKREGSGLTLTVTGAAYVGKLTGLLDGLEDSARAAMGGGGELRVLSTPNFAARWLAPRLDRFAFARDLRLRVSEGAPNTDFSRNVADVVVHWGDEPIEGAVVEPLMESRRYPVASPEFVQRERIEHPEDLLRLTLLHDEVMDGWAAWMRTAGMGEQTMPRGPRFAHCELVAMAAERGQGVALAYDAMVRGALAAGTLTRLFDTVTMPITVYSLAYPAGRAEEPRIRAFRDWLFAEVAAVGNLAKSRLMAAE